jgi:hypothetical protein
VDGPADDWTAGTFGVEDGRIPGVKGAMTPGVYEGITPGVDIGITPGTKDGVWTTLSAMLIEATGELPGTEIEARGLLTEADTSDDAATVGVLLATGTGTRWKELLGEQLPTDEEVDRCTSECPNAGTEGVAVVYDTTTDELNAIGNGEDVDAFELLSTGRGEM